ncbi:MAG TPA: hypothetical protein VF604_19500 [Pyrinomonadaceae bacterium]|jgi:hypothetical protein
MITRYSEHNIYKISPFWSLSDDDIREFHETGLEILSELLKKDSLSEYENTVLDALTQYSKCTLSRNPADKLINTLVALESLLLKDANEPIQQNLAERMAFLFKATSEERRAIKSSVLKAYSLRSSFIHHGKSIGIDELDILQDFLIYAWTSFYALIHFTKTYSTKAEIFDKLEELKLS